MFNVVSAATVFVFVVVVVLVADYLTVVCKINISRIYIISINFMYIDVYSICIRRLVCSSVFFLLSSLSMLLLTSWSKESWCPNSRGRRDD